MSASPAVHKKRPGPFLLRAREGALTQELVLHPGDFGLGKVPGRLKPDATTTVVCGYCSTGCGLNVHLKNGQAVNLTPSTDYPVNLGMACPKGWESLTPLNAPDRATTPLLRNQQGELEPTDWDRAMQVFTVRLKAIQDQFGKESVAWLGTGQICTEELAFLGALAKFGMGIVHGDGNTRQCMATAATAYKQSFGFDAPPFTYEDFEESDVIVLVGSNLCIAHPIMWQRVLRNKNASQIIVIDPRKTETAMAATQHYAIQPKTDLKLLYGVAHILIERGWIDPDYIANSTTGFAEFAEFLRSFTPEVIAPQCGLKPEQLRRLTETIHQGRRVSFWWTMGVNQGHEATRTAQAIINLALMTGNIGRPGTGANSVTGQCNAMGSRLFSNTTNLLGGHDFLNAAHREKVAGVLGISPALIPAQNSWAYDQIVQGIADGKIKGLWIVGTNSAHSWIHQSEFARILKKLDFLVVQDLYPTTETARCADLVLPAAGWGEKEGTFINSERRFGLVKRVARAPGQALSDFNIFKLAAHYWGCGAQFKEWTSPEAVFQILKKLSQDQPCDITGIRDYRMLDECGGVQWPLRNSELRVSNVEWGDAAASNSTAGSDPSFAPTIFEPTTTPVVSNSTLDIRPSKFQPKPTGVKEPSEPDVGLNAAAPVHSTFETRHSKFQHRRLFEDGRFYHPDGKARFVFEAPREAPEKTSVDFPLLLLTGRGTSAQWHTQTRTGKSAVLRQLYPKNVYVEINPADAARLGITAGQLVLVRSRRGEIKARAFVTATVMPRQVFIPMHYATVNQLTFPGFDPYSRQPAYKSCAVAIVPALTAAM
jgi:anaerobic selenocysteine-containing dehydrogenase